MNDPGNLFQGLSGTSGSLGMNDPYTLNFASAEPAGSARDRILLPHSVSNSRYLCPGPFSYFRDPLPEKSVDTYQHGIHRAQSD